VTIRINHDRELLIVAASGFGTIFAGFINRSERSGILNTCNASDNAIWKYDIDDIRPDIEANAERLE
jgi:hypothetical protein